MGDLWSVLGYDETASAIVRQFRVDSGINVLEGPPGVGKTWLAKDIGTLWESEGGSVVLAEGDALRADVSYYPFGFAMATLPSSWKNVRPAIAGVARASETLIGTAGLITSSFETVGKLRETRRERRRPLLDESEQKILHNLERLGKKRPLLLIADNLHWWDSKSLGFLGCLLSPGMIGAFPFLSTMRVLAVQTLEPHQTTANPEARDSLLVPATTHRFALGRIGRKGFDEVLTALGAAPDSSPESVELVYTLTAGHLALAGRCAGRMSAGDHDDLLAADDSDEFLHALLVERVDSLGPLGKQAVATLQVAAALGSTFRRDEVNCAVETDDSEVARILRHFRDEQVLELSDEIGRFVHDMYREYFRTVNVLDGARVHEVLSDCLRILRPSEYDLRCVNAMDADSRIEAAALGIHAGLQREREGSSWERAPSRILDAIDQGQMKPTMEALAEAQRHLRAYRFHDCREALSRIPKGVPESVHAEIDFIHASCLMSTRSEADRAEGRSVLEPWSDFKDVEPEIGTRLTQLHLYGLTHVEDKAKGKALENETRHFLRSRAPFDLSAMDALYSLDRCAGGLHNAETTLRMNREAANYFGPDEGQSLIRRPLEFYRCMVNLGASLICNARYEEARVVYEKVDALVDGYDDEVFPRLDYPRMNGLLAEFRAGSLTADLAVRRQSTIVECLTADTDPFYATNAQAVYLALSGHLDQALEIFDRLDSSLHKSRMEPEPSTSYLIRSNRCASRFVAGDHDGLAAEWRALTSLVEKNAYPSRPIYLRRHELLVDVFEEQEPLTAAEFDEVLISRHPEEFGPLWESFGRAFTMPAIEFWREN